MILPFWFRAVKLWQIICLQAAKPTDNVTHVAFHLDVLICGVGFHRESEKSLKSLVGLRCRCLDTVRFLCGECAKSTGSRQAAGMSGLKPLGKRASVTTAALANA